MPRLSDPPSAWHHLADRQSDGSPKIETGILASELQARMDAIGVSIAPTPASDIGRPIVGGFYLDVTVREVCSAAGYKDPDLRLDWRFVVGWLRDGLNPDKDILPAIRKIASRPNYVPPRSLKYFEEAMRERLRHVT